MVFLLCFTAALALTDEVGGHAWDERLYELVYQAEVHGKAAQSLEQLYALLPESDEAKETRLAIIRAISVVKRTLPPKIELDTGQTPQSVIVSAKAVICKDRLAYFLAQGAWFELGDWLGPLRIVDINLGQVVFEDTQNHAFTLPLPRLSEAEPSPTAEGGKFLEAPLGDILAFATRQASLNYYFPSGFNTSVSGYFAVPDWQALIDQLCHKSGIIWTRRLGSIVFERGARKNDLDTMLRGIDTKNRLLGDLLQEIADTVGLELVIFDEGLVEVAIDLHSADQPWDEALDCLSIMNGFNWATVPQKNGQDQLVVTRN